MHNLDKSIFNNDEIVGELIFILKIVRTDKNNNNSEYNKRPIEKGMEKKHTKLAKLIYYFCKDHYCYHFLPPLPATTAWFMQEKQLVNEDHAFCG